MKFSKAEEIEDGSGNQRHILTVIVGAFECTALLSSVFINYQHVQTMYFGRQQEKRCVGNPTGQQQERHLSRPTSWMKKV